MKWASWKGSVIGGEDGPRFITLWNAWLYRYTGSGTLHKTQFIYKWLHSILTYVLPSGVVLFSLDANTLKHNDSVQHLSFLSDIGVWLLSSISVTPIYGALNRACDKCWHGSHVMCFIDFKGCDLTPDIFQFYTQSLPIISLFLCIVWEFFGLSWFYHQCLRWPCADLHPACRLWLTPQVNGPWGTASPCGPYQEQAAIQLVSAP